MHWNQSGLYVVSNNNLTIKSGNIWDEPGTSSYDWKQENDFKTNRVVSRNTSNPSIDRHWPKNIKKDIHNNLKTKEIIKIYTFMVSIILWSRIWWTITLALKMENFILDSQ